jgi:hypothetical protein
VVEACSAAGQAWSGPRPAPSSRPPRLSSTRPGASWPTSTATRGVRPALRRPVGSPPHLRSADGTDPPAGAVTMRLSTRTCHQPLGPSPPGHGAARVGWTCRARRPRGGSRRCGPRTRGWAMAATVACRRYPTRPPGPADARCHAYLRMVTGVPSGSTRARMVMAPLSKRTQPLDTSRPRSPGSAVPCKAIWPSPVPNCSSTSE